MITCTHVLCFQCIHTHIQVRVVGFGERNRYGEWQAAAKREEEELPLECVIIGTVDISGCDRFC